MPTTVKTYNYPENSPASTAFLKAQAGGKNLFIYHVEAGDFASFECDGPVEVVIQSARPLGDIVRIAPLSRGIKPIVEGSRLTLQLPRPMDLLIEIPGLPHLFLYASLPEKNPPSPSAKDVLYFRSGQIHQVDELRLTQGQTLYVEGGAVLRGCIRATSADNIRLAGRGILDDSAHRHSGARRRQVIIEGCRDVTIEDLILVEPSSWMLSLGLCDNVLVRNIRELGTVSSSDGIDICGSTNVRVENCFLRNGDDCVVIKALDVRRPDKYSAQLSWAADVRNVEVVGCSLMSYLGGSAMEIGHETICNSIRDIRFRDCDVLAVHQYGSAFGIHNYDQAALENVLWEDIRVEHYYDKLLDFRISRSRYSKSPQRGHARNLQLRNCAITESVYNPGYTVSLMGGYDQQHLIQDVKFQNFTLSGRRILSADDMDLYTKYVEGLSFE